MTANIRIGCCDQRRPAAIAETSHARIAADELENRFDVNFLFRPQVLLSHFREVGHVDLIACLCKAFGDSNQIEAVLAGGIYPMNDQDRRAGFLVAVNVDRHFGVYNGLMRNRASPGVESIGVPEDFQSEEYNKQSAPQADKQENPK